MFLFLLNACHIFIAGSFKKHLPSTEIVLGIFSFPLLLNQFEALGYFKSFEYCCVYQSISRIFFRIFTILLASFMVEEAYLVFYQLYFNIENDVTAW